MSQLRSLYSLNQNKIGKIRNNLFKFQDLKLAIMTIWKMFTLNTSQISEYSRKSERYYSYVTTDSTTAQKWC